MVCRFVYALTAIRNGKVILELCELILNGKIFSVSVFNILNRKQILWSVASIIRSFNIESFNK